MKAVLDPSFVQPLTDAVAAVCDAVVREATCCGGGARSLASRELVRSLLPAAVRVQHLCVLGVCLLSDRLSSGGDAGAAPGERGLPLRSRI